MIKTLIAAAAIALSSPAAAWAVPPSHAGGLHGSPPGLSNNSSTKTPAAWCVEEREDLGVGKFNDEYGTNANESNAFGQCVSARAQDRDD